MTTINLLVETIKELHEAGKGPADVRFVSWEGFHCSWSEFAEAAKLLNYNNGYGGAKVVVTIRVVGDDWWLERGEYDGSEWWEFKTLPQKPKLARMPVEKDLRDD